MKDEGRLIRWYLRVYRNVLAVLPRDVREAHGEEMVALLQERLRDSGSVVRGLGFFLGAVTDAVWVGVSSRWESRGRSSSRLRYAARGLSRRPGFLIGTVTTLALALGLLTAVWTALDYTVLRSLPYPEDARLASANGGVVTPELVGLWNREAPGIEVAVPWQLGSTVVRSEDNAVHVRTMEVGAGFLELLGVRPLMGRLLRADDVERRRPVAVVSESIWISQFGEEAVLEGQSLAFDSRPFEIVGVIPSDFRYGRYRGIQAWIPIDPDETRSSAILRLEPGRDVDELLPVLERFSLDRVDPEVAARYTGPDARGTALRLYSVRESLQGSWRPQLFALALAGMIVLLVAAANVSSLFLARTEERRSEFAVRRSLGAGRGDLMRDVLAEAGVIALLGGVLGLLLAPFILNALLGTNPGVLHRLQEIRIDLRIAVFALVMSGLTVFLVGLLPALLTGRAARGPGSPRSTTGDRGTVRFFNGLVFVEIALAMVLIVGAGLVLRSYLVLFPTDPGFTVEDRVTVEFDLPRDTYPTPESARDFVRALERSAVELPGRPASEVSTSVPFDGLWWRVPVAAVDGEPATEEGSHNIHYRSVTPGYLEFMGFEILEGRSVTPEDGPSDVPVALVNRTAAGALWPETPSPVGRSLTLDSGQGPREWQIVGMVEDVRTEGTGTRARPAIFMPFAQAPQHRFRWVVDAGSGLAAGDLRAAVRRVDPGVPMRGMESFEELIGGSLRLPRFQLTLLGTLAAVGVVLAGLGCFSVLAYRIRRSTKEIGIRMALGARPAGVASRALRRILVLGVAACVTGAAGAWGLSAWIESRFFLRGVSVHDPLTYLAASVFLLLVLLAATLGPGMRAARVDPVTALRAE